MVNKNTNNKMLLLSKQEKMLNIPQQGQIWLVEFPPTKEDRKPTRPCLVISDNIQNKYGKWIVVIPFTTEDVKNIEPFEILVKNTIWIKKK